MTTLAFDTLRAAKLLRLAGFDESQAEVVVTTVGDALTENVATKADLNQVEAALKTEIAEVKAELKTDMAALRAELKTDLGSLEARLGGLEARRYRQLWVMAAGIVGLTVSLTVALVKLVL